MAASVSASGSMTSYWIKFFKDCGIPAGEATNYAITFTDNRITESMLLDLNKEYLADMGITVLGDVIAILKHAKVIHAQDTAKQRALRAATAVDVSPGPRRSTPASRTVNHYLATDPEASPMNAPAKPGPKMSKELAARLGPTPESAPEEAQKVCLTSKPSPVTLPSAPKIRRVLPEHEGRYKIIMPQGTTERSRRALQQQDQVPRPKKGSVFGRLGSETGSEEKEVTVTGLGSFLVRNTNAEEPSVFERLGKATKRPATSTSADSDDSDNSECELAPLPLEYAGVLKQDEAAKARLLSDKKKALEKRKLLQAAAAKKKKQLEAAQARKRQLEQRLGPQKVDVTTTAGILSLDAKQENVKVRSRLGNPTVVTAASSTTPHVSSTTPKPTAKTSVHARLGRQHTEVSSTPSSKGGVFKRLGKPVS